MSSVPWAILCLNLLLPTFCTYAKPVPDPPPPLYNQDPHDNRFPTYPDPTCSLSDDRGLDIAAFISTNGGIMDFCTTTHTISDTSQEPISAYYPAAKGKVIRFSLTWDNSGTCPRNQTTLSPSDNHGKGCQTIFRDIVLDCPYNPNQPDGALQSIGGSITFNCAIWEVGFV